jgi:hypothetical protein
MQIIQTILMLMMKVRLADFWEAQIRMLDFACMHHGASPRLGTSTARKQELIEASL